MINVFYFSKYLDGDNVEYIKKMKEFEKKAPVLGDIVTFISEKDTLFGKKPVLSGEDYYDIVNFLTSFIQEEGTFLVDHGVCEKFDEFCERPDTGYNIRVVGSIPL